VAVTESKADQLTYADEIDPADIAARIWGAKPADRADAEADAARHLPRHHEDRRTIRRATELAALAAEFDYPPHAPTVATGADAAQAAAAEIQTEGTAFRDGTNGAYRMGLAESGKTTIYDAEGAEALTLPTDEARLVGDYAVRTGEAVLSDAAVRPLTALMEGMLEDCAAGKPIDIRDAAPLGRQVANILAEAAPGLGEAMSAREAEIAGALALEAYENDELRDFLIYSVQTGVAAIGAIPLLGAVVRAPKKVIAAAGLILTYGVKNKGAKIAAVARHGRLPDGLEVSLRRSENTPAFTICLQGGEKKSRFEALGGAMDSIENEKVYAEIGKMIDGSLLNTTKIGGSDSKRQISLDRLGGESAADQAFEALARALELPIDEIRDGIRRITIPNANHSKEPLVVMRYRATTRDNPSVVPQIKIRPDLRGEIGGIDLFSIKIRFKD